ncbi:MAG: hypothetical protein IKQ23_01425, partial [Treponema sp.]|nr:hypothetical protein [Treponema sp.]
MPFFKPGFLAKTRMSFCKQLTRRPWRYRFAVKNGKVFAFLTFVKRQNCRPKKKNKHSLLLGEF